MLNEKLALDTLSKPKSWFICTVIGHLQPPHSVYHHKYDTHGQIFCYFACVWYYFDSSSWYAKHGFIWNETCSHLIYALSHQNCPLSTQLNIWKLNHTHTSTWVHRIPLDFNERICVACCVSKNPFTEIYCLKLPCKACASFIQLNFIYVHNGSLIARFLWPSIFMWYIYPLCLMHFM